MIELLVGAAAIWGAALSTLLAVQRIIGNRVKLFYEVKDSYVSSTYDPLYSVLEEGLSITLNVKNHGKNTTVHEITLKIDKLKGWFEPRETEPKPIPEENETYFPMADINAVLLKGGSKNFSLFFIDDEIKKFLKKRKGKFKGKLRICDTYKEKEIEVKFSKSDRQSPEQRNFEKNILQAGGFYFIVRTVDHFYGLYNKMLDHPRIVLMRDYEKKNGVPHLPMS